MPIDEIPPLSSHAVDSIIRKSNAELLISSHGEEALLLEHVLSPPPNSLAHHIVAPGQHLQMIWACIPSLRSSTWTTIGQPTSSSLTTACVIQLRRSCFPVWSCQSSKKSLLPQSLYFFLAWATPQPFFLCVLFLKLRLTRSLALFCIVSRAFRSQVWLGGYSPL